MEWLPKWLGKVYCKLWAQFGEGLFLFENADMICGKLTLNYLSELKRAQALFIFERALKKRVYRLIPPNYFAISLANNLNLKWLTQGVYANLIIKVFSCLKERFGLNLSSLGVYGSVARNQAKKESDLDIFLVFKEISGNISERLDLLSDIVNTDLIKDELKSLRARSYFPRINLYPRKESELRLSFFTIDIAFDMKPVYDTNILQPFLSKIYKRIQDQKIKRIYLQGDKFYLDLNLKFGEVFEFE